MSERFEIRLAGTGGQGMILAGIILADAVASQPDKHVVQTQSYGPEARGGASKSEVIISDSEIDYPKVIEANLLLALSQEACDKYGQNLNPEGWIIVDSGEVQRVPPHPKTIRVPITHIAEEKTGRKITANVVSLALIVGLTEIVSREALVEAVSRWAPKGTQKINQKAVEAGFAKADQLQGRQT